MTDRLKAVTKRNQGREFDAVIREINAFLRGWLNYYGLASAKVWLTETEAWLRRRIRTKAKGGGAETPRRGSHSGRRTGFSRRYLALTLRRCGPRR